MKTFKIILIILAVLLVLGIGLSFLAFHLLFASPKRSKKVPDYYVGTPHYVASRKGMALMDKLPVEDLYITSRDGLKLHAYLYPAEGGERKKFVIGIHGYKSYARPEFGPYIEFYRSLGYNLLLPDDRAHRPSEGKYIGFGVLDRLDAVDWAKYVVEMYGDDVEILMHGVSMGSATVMAASAEEDLPVNVFGVVADCGYTSAHDILSYQMKQMKLPVKMVLPCVELVTKMLAGYGFDEHTPIEAVKKARVPILFVQGKEDKMVPEYMCHELYDACTSRKELLYSETAGHGETIAIEKDRYEETIRRFFDI